MKTACGLNEKEHEDKETITENQVIESKFNSSCMTGLHALVIQYIRSTFL